VSPDPLTEPPTAPVRGTAREVADHLPVLLSAVRGRRPLVHLFANLVTAQAVANAVRALGALPVMAMARDDAEEMAAQADALVLSLGTPSPERLEAMLAAGRRAAARGTPIVLDPVGVGATAFRSAAAQRLLGDLPVAVIRANRGEAAALLGHSGQVRGVESSAEGGRLDPERLAPALARVHRCVAAITGPRDCVADVDRMAVVENGHPWLQAVSGTGCMVTALVGAFCAVGQDSLVASASALACFGVAAEMAAGRAQGPGTLIPGLLDALYHVSPEHVTQAARVKES
jgi:hydroxyethylthiazole kinase